MQLISMSSERKQYSGPTLPPRFLTYPENQIARVGDTVTFECLVLWAKGQTKTTWSKGGDPIASEEARITIQEIGEVRRLQITQVQPSDRAVYNVTLENSHGRAERTVRLDLLVRENMKSAGFCCSTTTTVIQKKEEEEERWGSSRRNPKGQVEVISLRQSKVGQELISMPNISRDQLLPPTFTQHLVDSTSVEGKSIELIVQVKGADQVIWLKNEQLVANSPYFLYAENRSSGIFKLVINDPFVQDSGLYVCEAYNKAGGSISFGKLTIIPDPMTEYSTTSNHEKLIQRERASRAMTSMIHNVGEGVERNRARPNLPPKKVLSYKSVMEEITLDQSTADQSNRNESIVHQSRLVSTDDQEVDLSLRKVTETIVGVAEVIEFTKVEVHDPPRVLDESFRAYSPYAKTSSDSDDHDGRHDSGIIAGLEGVDKPSSSDEEQVASSLSLDYGKPGILSSGKFPTVMGPSYLLVMKGEQVNIRVKYSGNPQPEVEWTKNGKECDRESIRDTSTLSTMCISAVSYDDSGRYVTKISNDHGTIYHHCFLAVEGSPLPPSTPPTSILNLDTVPGSITVSWSGSPYDGGSILTAYVVEMSVNDEEWKELAAVNSLTFSLTQLKSSTKYQFRVACENMYGVGPPSEPSDPLVIPETEKSQEVNEPEPTFVPNRDVQLRRGNFQDFYIKGEQLGKGRYGTVFTAKDKVTGDNFAGKLVRCVKVSDKVKVRKEVEIMNNLRHPNLLQIVDALENDREVCIITEKIYGGELFERVVAEDEPLTEFDCIGFMRQICDGVRFMHEANIIHMDLKPENILCLTRSSYNIKIIDFGISQTYDKSVPLRVLFGTPEFIAPEIINYEPISPASDLWALGVITYVLLSGLSPFMGDTDTETFSNITQGLYDFDDDSFDAISDDAKDFISQLLIRRQDKRLTAIQCLDHKWLAYPEPKKNIVIPKLNFDKLKKFVIRRKWQKTGNAIRALGRMANMSRRSTSSELSPSDSIKSEGWYEPERKREPFIEEEREDTHPRRQPLRRQDNVDTTF